MIEAGKIMEIVLNFYRSFAIQDGFTNQGKFEEIKLAEISSYFLRGQIKVTRKVSA
jgi:hypothetical protein